MNKLAMLVLMGLISTTVNAANWVLVASNSVSSTYVETESISNSGVFKQAFTRLDYYEIQETIGKKYDSITSLDIYDCDSKPMRRKSLSFSARLDDRVVHSSNKLLLAEWNYVYPDTLGEEEADFICSY